MQTDPTPAEARAGEALAQAYEATRDAQGDSPRFHAANVRVIGRRDYADWKDRAAIAAMLAFRDAETAALRAENARLREALDSIATLATEARESDTDTPFSTLAMIERAAFDDGKGAV